MFSKEEYQRRRNRLVSALGKGIIILPSYTTSRMSNDVDYEFRQQTDLWYFTGFPEPNTVAVIEVTDDETIFSMFVPERDKEFEIWHGKRYGKEGVKKYFQADEAYTFEEFEDTILEKLKKYENVFYPLGENPKIDDIIQRKMIEATKSRDRTGKGPLHMTNPLYSIHEIRAVKTEEELKVIRQSAKISAEAMELGICVTKPGMSERQVEAAIEYHYAKNEANRPAYPTIAGSGANATILHYIENSEKLNDGDLLLVDAGAEYQGYASDITRTWPVSGTFTKAQKTIYQLVLDVQKKCIAMVEPGKTIQEIHDKAVELLSRGLVELGLLEGDLEEIIENEEYKRFFMHGIGHFLGMDVHDTSLLGREYTLQPNHYFTIEPGIYVPVEDDIPEEYRGIGIRIEDDILVTEDGYENMTQDVVREIDEIEGLVGTKDMP